MNSTNVSNFTERKPVISIDMLSSIGPVTSQQANQVFLGEATNDYQLMVNEFKCSRSPSATTSPTKRPRFLSDVPPQFLDQHQSLSTTLLVPQTICGNEDTYQNMSDFNNMCDLMSNEYLQQPVTTTAMNTNYEDQLITNSKNQNGHDPHGQNDSGFKLKHKTELCRNWEQGSCPYGNQCAYAHGNEELLKKKHLPTKYKTRLCKQYHNQLYCPYGIRCQFVHSTRNPIDSQDSQPASRQTLVSQEQQSKLSYSKMLNENINQMVMRLKLAQNPDITEFNTVFTQIPRLSIFETIAPLPTNYNQSKLMVSPQKHQSFDLSASRGTSGQKQTKNRSTRNSKRLQQARSSCKGDSNKTSNSSSQVPTIKQQQQQKTMNISAMPWTPFNQIIDDSATDCTSQFSSTF